MKQLDTIGNDEEQHLEKSRVILGCYLLSASVSAYYKHMESLPWTPHLEDCLQRLESSAGACPSDSVLVVQVRLQHLAQKAHEIHRHQDPLSPPLILYCDAIREQLRQVETLITPSMAKAAEASQNAAEPSGKHSSESLKWIWQSAMAVKSCFEIWTSVSPSIWVGLSIQYTLQVGRCLMTLFRLSTLSGTARDLEAVRKSLDALAIIDCVIGVTAQASVEAGETAGDDLFKKMLRNLQGFREGMLASLTSEQETIGSGDASEDGMAEDHRNRIVPAPVLFEMPAYGFFGTGEWMEQIFDSGPC
ncbi:hypothetical protein M406DRAFT_333055 [Cryphonectria parasitica EP155]|uniref:Uncharacterized protein n=1 Tax=Cryphonectria parasitica (strain ATCC 38755 / EP155) TaxID=660469 RepID=A0A9P4XWP4_CRYP1|nr:uncharacterized protein M406DRAFT_333055 [Cryphonectria parasitica EP155]KAF3762684.1 hypothetical protein M406DRAFT_333055 [Cryphonectria parasitica EP155]